MKTFTWPVLLACVAIGCAFPLAHVHAESLAMHKSAQQFIADFKRGREFGYASSVAGLVKDHRLVPGTLDLLRRQLATGSADVRENVVKLLEAVGLALDKPEADKFPVIRDRAVIRMLAGEGFAKDDKAASAAAQVLADACRPEDLAAANDLFLDSLRQGDPSHLNLAVKAKTPGAKQYVERMAARPEWREDPDSAELINIARAALGNTVVEDAFIEAVAAAVKQAPPAPPNRFYHVGAARDGSEVARRLAILGRIGTTRSLLVACSMLRSTLKSYVPQVSEKLVRQHALDALRFNFPDQRILHGPGSVAEWTAAEAFCTTRLGARFDGPRPDLPAAHVYPHR